MNMVYDAVIVGAGPAGMSAATLLSQHGANVVVVDEQPGPGGQIYRNLEAVAAREGLLWKTLGPDYARGKELLALFRDSGAQYLSSTRMWHVGIDGEVFVSSTGRSFRIKGRAVVLATGAMERPVPVPGWTLSGTMTVGALQVILKSSGAVPDGRVVLAGSGPLIWLVAHQLLDFGVDVMAIVESTSARNAAAALRHWPRAMSSPEGRAALAKGLRLMAEVRRRGVSVYSGASDLKIEGADHVIGLTFRSLGRFRRLSATLVALHEGIVPMQHPARVAGLVHQWNGVHAYFQPEVDEYGEASPGGIFVVGDGASILGAKAAEHSGRLAGLRILERLRMIDAATFVELSSHEFKARALHTGWRKFIDALYAPPDCIGCPGDDIMVCRCEEVLAGEIRAIASAGCVGPNQTKAFLRSGMGPCQGRICGTVISRLVAETHNREMDDIGHFRIRPPIKPVSLGELSSIETQMLEYPAE